MEYQFYRDFSSDELVAETPDELAAFGRWLTEALRSPDTISALLAKLDATSPYQATTMWLGHGWLVELDNGVVTARLYNADEHEEQLEPFLHPDMHFAYAEAGLEDVVELIEAWLDFLRYR